MGKYPAPINPLFTYEVEVGLLLNRIEENSIDILSRLGL
jgi:hypothetical protein